MPRHKVARGKAMVEKIWDKISISNLVDGFAEYKSVAFSIVRHPFKFPETLEVDGDEAFSKALNLVLYAITLLFFLLIPIFAKNATEVPKLTFLVRFLVQMGMYGFLLHLTLRWIGAAKKGFKSSVVAYTYIVIVGAPLAVVVEYPVLLSFGPAAIFGTPKDVYALSVWYNTHIPILIYMMSAFTIISILGFVIMINWFSKTHSIGKIRTFFCIMLAGLAGAPIQIWILNPVFLAVFERVDEFLKYA
jgi:hypothetical protein